MSVIHHEQLKVAGSYIFRTGRLLERQLYNYAFDSGTKEACLKALLAYQNPDGGFGNGIEPDLLCPESSAIGAETALFTLEVLDYHGEDVVGPLVDWVSRNQTEMGEIPHPPAGFDRYPFQAWWDGPDDVRILPIVGLLTKWGMCPDEVAAKARQVYLRRERPAPDQFYGYPDFIYLKYCAETAEDRAALAQIIDGLPTLLESAADHFPLFSRAWFHAADCVAPEVLEANARAFAAAFEPDGGVVSPYPDLPWWRPIMTLDGLVLLKRLGFLGLLEQEPEAKL